MLREFDERDKVRSPGYLFIFLLKLPPGRRSKIYVRSRKWRRNRMCTTIQEAKMKTARKKKRTTNRLSLTRT